MAKRPVRIVAIGGSAGGLESLQALLKGIPRRFPCAIVAVLHLDPSQKSLGAQILAAHTSLVVTQPKAGEPLRRGHVYLATPDHHLGVKDGCIALSQAPRIHYSRPSIDFLLDSVAESGGKGAVAVILSGTGSDGSQGIRAIKSIGGTIIAEDPRTASQPGMPESAISTGCVDAVLSANKIGHFLNHLATTPAAPVPQTTWRTLAKLLSEAGTDFSGYRKATLMRQVQRRIAATESRTAANYARLVRQDPAELDHLRNVLLVKVSAFRRDPDLWQALEDRVLTPLMSRGTDVRMWCAGCATGEEVYTLAAAALGRQKGGALKVFGTDIDNAALATARAARYPAVGVAPLGTATTRAFFTRDGHETTAKARLRRHVVFGIQNLIRDPPLADMDVVLCRNVLIYLDEPERQNALQRLTESLKPGGILFLGKAEGMQRPGPGLERIGPGLPIFRRTSVDLHPRRQGRNMPRRPPPSPAPQQFATPAVFVINKEDHVVLWSREAAQLFGRELRNGETTPMTQLLPGPVAAAVAQARLSARRQGAGTSLTHTNSLGTFRLTIKSSRSDGGNIMVRVTATRVGAAKALAPTVVPASGTELLQVANEELAALNEELQSTSASQQALLEELQSRNEELETVNEELQSLNSEVENQGTRHRRDATLLQAMLDLPGNVVLACDMRGRITTWGVPAAKHFGIPREEAVGKDLFKLLPQFGTRAVRAFVVAKKGTKSPPHRSLKLTDGSHVTLAAAHDARGAVQGCMIRVDQDG